MISRPKVAVALAVSLVMALAFAAGSLGSSRGTTAQAAPADSGPIFEHIADGVAAVQADVKYKVGPYALDLEKVTIPVGGVVPWHCHPGPTTFIMVQGELTTFAPDGSSRVLGPGDADVEQIGTPRESENLGTEDIVAYIQFAPPEGLPNTIWLSGPDDKCKF